MYFVFTFFEDVPVGHVFVAGGVKIHISAEHVLALFSLLVIVQVLARCRLARRAATRLAGPPDQHTDHM